MNPPIQNTSYKIPHTQWNGFTLIEAVVLLFIFSVTTLTFYQAFTLGTTHIIESKNRRGGIALANERMEQIRNLPYDEVAVQGGVPAGSIDPDEIVVINTRQFHVLTEVRYVDDADDGTLSGSPNDAIPNDYKIVDITVRWGEEAAQQSIQLVSRFVPPGGLETSAGGGVLSVNVLDSTAASINSASVHLVNTETDPAIDTTNTTNNFGNLLIPGAPPATESYQITVSKSGYETAATLPPYPTTAYYPTYTHVSVNEGLLQTVTMIINRLADAHFSTENPLGEALPNISFNLSGGQVLGVDTGGATVYGYSDAHTSNGSGTLTLDDMNPGSYTLTVTDNAYELLKVDPGNDVEENMFDLPSGADDAEIAVILMDKSVPSLFVKAADASTSSPIEGATVRLENAPLIYDVSVTTDIYGFAYFPHESASPLVDGENYNLTVSASGYDDTTKTVTINALVTEEINLVAQ